MRVELIQTSDASHDGRKPPPIVYGRFVYAEPHPEPPSPLVPLYVHYDVVPPAGPNDFKPEKRNGRITGRGSADDKAGIMVHLITCQFLKEGLLPRIWRPSSGRSRSSGTPPSSRSPTAETSRWAIRR